MENNSVRGNINVGVGVIILNHRKEILMGKRKSRHGLGQFSIPGGAVDVGEKLTDCAVREVFEETGLKLQSVKILGITNNLETFFSENTHSLSVIFFCKDYDGEPEIKEPDKHEAWAWHNMNSIPEPHFEASKKALDLYSRLVFNNEWKILIE